MVARTKAGLKGVTGIPCLEMADLGIKIADEIFSEIVNFTYDAGIIALQELAYNQYSDELFKQVNNESQKDNLGLDTPNNLPANFGDSTTFGGGGGPIITSVSAGSDNNSVTEEEEEEEVRIFNELTGKALCVYNKLRISGTDFVENILGQFEGESEFDILIKSEETVFSRSSNKFVNGITTYRKGEKQIKIFISSEKVNAKSVLSVARTLIHEYVHADMFRKLNTQHELTQEELDFKTTYEKFEIEKQHEAMAELYVNSIADALKEFHKTILTGDYNYLSNDGQHPISDTFYEALAWQGLKNHNVKAYVDLSDEKKSVLENALQTYFHDTTKNCQN